MESAKPTKKKAKILEDKINLFFNKKYYLRSFIKK